MTGGRYRAYVPGCPPQTVDLVESRGGLRVENMRRYGLEGQHAKLVAQGVRFRKLGPSRKRRP